MRILCSLLMLLSYAAFATSARVKIVGEAATDLEEVWTLIIQQKEWSGHLDCQGFIHKLALTRAGLEYARYMEEPECNDWASRLHQAGPLTPLCISVGNEGLALASCLN